MKVIMVIVASVNGKITRGHKENIHSWTSDEDANFFSALIKKHNLIVMGNKTYQAERSNIKLDKNKLRVVYTKNPKKYSKDVVLGSLEFTNESPKQLIAQLEKRGFKQMLLVGGGQINALFLKSDLVNELYLTIEPVIFGQGQSIVAEEHIETPLKLLSVAKINKRGTLLLKYIVDHS